ncbi:hypothetical protein [Enterococcus sp. DIV1298c]|uniref:hypothetical protein n=1 Tax=Enterococcus sp. DIV1298c TaxID=2815328 RepID=UPI001A90D0A4|nr:hypothetical protein [Enterococcus sp. DIV1298c]
MKIFREYKATKQPTDDFLSWLFIRRINLRVKLLFIAILWIGWLRFSFDLVFMVRFFQFVFIGFLIYLMYLLVLLIKKIAKFIVRR